MSPSAETDITVLDHAPVVVIGAGYAGLSAALVLHDHGLRATVLEGADRVGGRIWTQHHVRAGAIDHGGQWAGPTQHRLLALAERFACARFPTWDSGNHLERWHDGTVRPFRDAGPEAAPGMAAYNAAVIDLEKLAATVELDAPPETPGAEALDSETVESYLHRTVASADARRRLRLAVQGVFSTEPRDMSVLHLAFYIASAGGYEQLMETAGCAQEQRFIGGAQAPALAITEHLGGSVHLDSPVRAVERTRDGYQVRTPTSAVHTDHVIVALPPPAIAKIDFDPPLPVDRARWTQRSVMGDVAKMHLTYPRPFWRDAGLSGQATLYGSEPVGVTFDNSPPDASAGVLVCFVYGDRLRHWSRLGTAGRRASIIETATTLFGSEASEPEDYLEQIWPEDRFARGGYAAIPAPGAWHEYGHAWRTPVEGLHWAGTETASVWHGYMDGAISSGERAAREVLESVATTTATDDRP